MINNTKYNVDLGNSSVKKIMFQFAKEMHFDERAPGNKKDRDRSLLRLLKSHSIMVSASGISTSPKKNLSRIQHFYHLTLMNFVIY